MIKVEGAVNKADLPNKTQLGWTLLSMMAREGKRDLYDQLLDTIHIRHRKSPLFKNTTQYVTDKAIVKAVLNTVREDMIPNPFGGYNMDESTLSFKFEELVEFIVKQRNTEQHFWWLAIFDPSEPSPLRVSTSCRGFFEGGYWMPVDDELCEHCEATIRKVKTSNKIYGMLEHCATREHIVSMLRRRTNVQLEAEYQYMLDQVMDVLAEKL